MVSIITPAYNAEKYLAATVASVISQSHRDWELLLVDDGSTDSTPALCDSLADSHPRIRVFHRPNSGPASARNFALDRARGEYIVFLDADDILNPDFLRILVSVARRTHAPIVITPCRPFTDNSPCPSAPYTLSAASFSTIADPIIMTPDEALVKALYQTPLHATDLILDNAPWGKLYRRELWDNMRFTPGIWYEDLDIFYRLWMQAEKIAVFPTPLIGYRQHQSSCMHTFSPRRLDSLDVTDRMVRWMQESDDPRITPRLRRAAEVRRFAARCNVLKLLYTAPRLYGEESPGQASEIASGLSRKEVEKRCWDTIRTERKRVLFDKCARRRDRLGALLTLLGRNPFRLVSRLVARR